MQKKEMKNTLKKRYEKIIVQINKIWKFEKDKFILRNKLEATEKEIKVDLESNRSYNQSDFAKSSAANITNVQKIEEIIKKDIKEIEKKQLGELKEIENNVIKI